MTNATTSLETRAESPSAGAKRRSARRLRWVLLPLLCVPLGLLLWPAWLWSEALFLGQIRDESRQTLELYVSRLAAALGNPGDPALIAGANTLLEEVNGITGASDTYLMDREGLTIAASNWDSETPFVGRNFGFRPYFQQAMEGRTGRYFALGSTSNRRGYYFAHPVARQGTILGAVVLKVSAALLEEAWAQGSNAVMVTDRDGVVFLTSEPGWHFRALRPLSPNQVSEIRRSRRYSEAEIRPFPLLSAEALDGGAQLLTLARDDEGGGRALKYLAVGREVPEFDWTVYVLAATGPAGGRATSTVTTLGFALALIALAAAYLVQRRGEARRRLSLEREAQRSLEAAYGALEQRVAERTKDLVEANLRLNREVEERERAEADLRRAQDELIQASKLAALGQLAAGISHEINQPLAAIRGYADNARTFLERGRETEVHANLEVIAEQTGRMAEIVRRLKAFARKSSGRREPMAVQPVIEDTLRLLTRRIGDSGVSVKRDLPEAPVEAFSDPVRLGQVLLNILGNALDAVEDLADPEIRIALQVPGPDGPLRLSVSDNGPGIAADDLPRIFDPFFTTKEVGRGLGLGLSISYGIVRDLGGTIRAASGASGGAVFSLELPTRDDSAAAAP
jgi:two-component system C4-dicarboxylate transport sensor histidine kinase DctB